MSKPSFAPKQARSRKTHDQLIAAARDILNERGLDAATVPRVADRAGLSPASVYRRFPSKDALMRAVLLGTLESLDANAAAKLTPELAQRYSLRQFAEMAVRNSLAHQRKNGKMLRALLQFVLNHPSAAFRKRVAELNIRSVQRVADFLLLKRSEIKHPQPEQAVSFALMLVGFALQEIVVLDTLPNVADPRLPKTDDDLVQELTRAFLGYLGAA